jgi:hypothetical protein
MRLLFPVLSLPLLDPAASAAQTPAPSASVRDMPVINPTPDSKACPPTSRYEAARRGGRLGAQKLDELPMADGYKAVLRQVGGCNAPIIVSYGIGREQR